MQELRINGRSLLAHARVADNVTFIVVDNGPETVVASVRTLDDVEWWGGRYFDDRGKAMRVFADLVSIAHTSKEIDDKCRHGKREKTQGCRCGDYVACCSADLDEHVCAMMDMQDAKHHG